MPTSAICRCFRRNRGREVNIISLVNQAVVWYAVSAVLALLFSLKKPLSGAIAGIGGAVASAMLIVVGMGTLLMPGRVSAGMLQMLSLPIRISGINALWLLAIGLSALPISLFNISWHRHPEVKANGLLVNLLLAAATCAVVTTSFGSLVVMAEIMALCGAFLTGCAQSGKLWFALGRFGTLLLAWSCWLVWSFYGTLDLAQISLLAAGARSRCCCGSRRWRALRCWRGLFRCTAGRRRPMPTPARRPPRCSPR